MTMGGKQQSPAFPPLKFTQLDVNNTNIAEEINILVGQIKPLLMHEIENNGSLSDLRSAQYTRPVSYTHLDVYKRQVLHYLE